MHLLSHKPSLIFSGILLLLLLMNNYSRLGTLSHNAITYISPSKHELILPQNNKKIVERLQANYKKYQNEYSVTTKNSKSASLLAQENAELEANQSGRLNRVLAGDNILSLKAIINNAAIETTALIAITNKKDQKTTIEKHQINSQVLEFTIENIGETEVEIKRILNGKPQNLTLVMYK